MSTPEESSKLRIVSLGIVAINKPPRTYIIEAVMTEKNPFFSGEATDNVNEYEAKAEGEDGADAVDLKLKTTNTVEAEWIPLNCPNRLTAPDVRRGDEVLLLQYADSDRYFWVQWRRNPKITRLETITYAVSNERRENVELDHTNTYFLHISTHEKLIHIETTKSDGEPYAYIIQVNTKDGIVSIRDDIGQEFNINSKEHLVQLKNTDGCLFELNKRVVNMKGVDEINLDTKRYTLRADQSITETTKDYKVTTNNYTFKGKQFDATATFKYNGAGSISGNWAVGGNLTVEGTSNHKGQSTGPGHR